MKVQIRRSVFETNSSTNHTLAIRRKAIDSTNRGLTLNLAETPFKELEKRFYPEVVSLNELTLQEKVDVLFYSILAGYCECREVLESIIRIQDILEKYDITVNVNWKNLRENLDNYFDTSIFSLVNQRLSSEEDIIQFLFSDESYYTEYCDECGNLPSVELIAIDEMTYNNKDFIYITERM